MPPTALANKPNPIITGLPCEIPWCNACTPCTASCPAADEALPPHRGHFFLRTLILILHFQFPGVLRIRVSERHQHLIDGISFPLGRAARYHGPYEFGGLQLALHFLVCLVLRSAQRQLRGRDTGYDGTDVIDQPEWTEQNFRENVARADAVHPAKNGHGPADNWQQKRSQLTVGHRQQHDEYQPQASSAQHHRLGDCEKFFHDLIPTSLNTDPKPKFEEATMNTRVNADAALFLFIYDACLPPKRRQHQGSDMDSGRG